MKVVYTKAALSDLEHIGHWLSTNYPAVAPAVAQRVRRVAAHLALWPEAAQRSTKRTGVRVIPLGRYPYKIFYRVTEDAVEILHIHHAAQQPWDEQS
jgi:toxin ParE1/3/4